MPDLLTAINIGLSRRVAKRKYGKEYSKKHRHRFRYITKPLPSEEFEKRNTFRRQYKPVKVTIPKKITKQKKCQICKIKDFYNPRTKRNLLIIDHDHKTGKLRGKTCPWCNSVLGFADDNVEILLSAVRYLQRS